MCSIDGQEVLLKAEKRAIELGHTIVYDPTHALSKVLRWTCSTCGRAALQNDANAYGSATKEECDVSN